MHMDAFASESQRPSPLKHPTRIRSHALPTRLTRTSARKRPSAASCREPAKRYVMNDKGGACWRVRVCKKDFEHSIVDADDNLTMLTVAAERQQNRNGVEGYTPSTPFPYCSSLKPTRQMRHSSYVQIIPHGSFPTVGKGVIGNPITPF